MQKTSGHYGGTRGVVASSGDGFTATRSWLWPQPPLRRRGRNWRIVFAHVLKEMHRIDAAAPVIMITGFASTDTVVKAMKIGAIDFVEKSFELSSLVSKVEAVLTGPRFLQTVHESEC